MEGFVLRPMGQRLQVLCVMMLGVMGIDMGYAQAPDSISRISEESVRQTSEDTIRRISEESVRQSDEDTIRQISEVTVRGQMRYHETIVPQTLKADALARMSAHTVADALRWMSGVQLKDYGGIGGLKTVNLRSMGSHHVGIYYDGIELGNAQNGVIDLGQFSLDNVEEVSLYNGQRSAVLQTASDFANAGSIYIRTVNPASLIGARPQCRYKVQYGSSQTLRTSVLHSRPLSQRMAISINAEGLSSSGHYPFTYRRRNLDGSLAYDTTAIRQNGDVQALRLEANLHGRLEHGQWQAKAYTYASNRGIPGAIVNNVWRRGERQTDSNTFAQASWQRDVTQRYTIRAQAKYAYYRTHYVNNDTTRQMIDQTYRQHEAYANLTQVMELTPWWSASLSYDVRYNTLESDRPLFARPSRLSHYAALASAMTLDRLHLQGSLVACMVNDRVRLGRPSGTTSRHAPALFASYDATAWMQLNGFAKKSFRMPTFNDLYYTDIGNADLRPETARQYALGVKIRTAASQPREASIDLQLYHNAVSDKIVAYPKGQQFRWTMLNLGSVSVNGIELRADSRWQASGRCTLRAMLQYTYQQAIDVTAATDAYYRHQIPYTPWHSGSASLMADVGRFAFGYHFVYTGERYCQQENIAYNHLQPWYTSDVTASYTHGRWRAVLEVRNVLDQQYDVIINYPMPGINYQMSIQCQY